MKYFTSAFLISLLTGCSGYVDDPSEIIKHLKECESVGMMSKIITTPSQNIDFRGCVPRNSK